MLEILVATNGRTDVQGIAAILSRKLDCHIEYLEKVEEIKERLRQDDIDIYVDEFEVYRGRVAAISEFISKEKLNTVVTTLAEPKNFAAVYQNKQETTNFCLLKPVKEIELLFSFQQVADRKIFASGVEYRPTVDELFNRTRGLVLGNFWQELLCGRGPYEKTALLDQSALSVGIANINRFPILPVLYISSSTERDLDFVNNKAIYESMAMALIIRESEGYAQYVSDGILAILFFPYHGRLTQNWIILRCYQFCEELERQFNLEGTCIIGEPCIGVELNEQWRRLQEKAKNIRFRKGRVFRLDTAADEESIVRVPQIAQWTELIVSGDMKSILTEIRHFFITNEKHSGMTRDLILSLGNEINRSVSIAMLERGSDASQSKPVLDQYFKCADSREDFLEWISGLTEWCRVQGETGKSNSIVEEAVSYIQKNLGTDLKRQSIADHVHVSQNYLARLFRNKLGTTMSDYINDERLKVAARLLTKTNLTIAEIAIRTGFASQTYFSSSFKQRYGVSPRTYRDGETERK